MNNMLHLPPIPTSILGLSNIEIEDAAMDSSGDFIIKVKSIDKIIKCQKCGDVTSPHGYNRSIRLRHLPVFGHKTYIETSPARGICNKCDNHPTTTESSDWYNSGSSYTKAYEKHVILSLINSTISDVSMKEDLGYKAVEAIVDRYIESEVNWDDILEIGLPTATEALDPISPQYMQDLITWSAIGARTTESQTHREMASGLSSSVGFKNGTDGSLTVAINALQSVASPHRFLGINSDGRVSVITTKGNPYAHVVLRGGNGKPNYDSVSVSICEQELSSEGITPNIMVDCSHANSNKDHNLQPLVLENVANQILEGNTSIIGAMVESHLKGGNQKLSSNPDEMAYGVSVTDACIDWETTEASILGMADKLRDVLKSR